MADVVGPEVRATASAQRRFRRHGRLSLLGVHGRERERRQRDGHVRNGRSRRERETRLDHRDRLAGKRARQLVRPGEARPLTSVAVLAERRLRLGVRQDQHLVVHLQRPTSHLDINRQV